MNTCTSAKNQLHTKSSHVDKCLLATCVAWRGGFEGGGAKIKNDWIDSLD